MTTLSNPTTPSARGARRTNALPDGHLLDEYRIDAVLGAGGFGVTYKAFDTHLENWVAIKEYFPIEWSFRDPDGVTVYANTQGQSSALEGQSSDYEWGLERFLDEARVLARVQHPYVVRIKRYFRAHGTAYIVMDYEEGEPLSAILRDGETLGEEQVRGLLEDVLPALQAVHDQGYLHRDIKPANLYVRARDHRVMLIDFGAARAAISRHSQSVTSMVTPGYSPPEQYTTRNDRYGPWTDIYALGAVLYRCVTGQIPIEAADRLMDDTLKPAEEVSGGRYSTNLLRAIDRALAVWPEQRLRSVGEIQALLGGSPDQDSDETVIMMPLPKISKSIPDQAILRAAIEGAGLDRAAITQPPTETRRTVGQRRDVLQAPTVANPPHRSFLTMAVGSMAALSALAAMALWLWPSSPVTDVETSSGPSSTATIAPAAPVADATPPAETIPLPAAPVADVAVPVVDAATPPVTAVTVPASPTEPIAPPPAVQVDSEPTSPAKMDGDTEAAQPASPNATSESKPPPSESGSASVPLAPPAIAAPSAVKPPADTTTGPVKAKPDDDGKKPPARNTAETRPRANRQKARREQTRPQPIIVTPAAPTRTAPTAPHNNPWDSPASSGFNQK